MMLDHLGHGAAAGDVLAAMESTLAKPETRTGDLGGSASTVEVTEALVAQLGLATYTFGRAYQSPDCPL